MAKTWARRKDNPSLSVCLVYMCVCVCVCVCGGGVCGRARLLHTISYVWTRVGVYIIIYSTDNNLYLDVYYYV